VKAVDRITEALERAQESGTTGKAGGEEILRPSLTPIAPVTVIAPVQPLPERRPGTPPAKPSIVYSRTRVARVPLAELVERHVVVDGASPDLVNAIKLIRTQIVQKMRENGWKTLGIVSPGDDEGKTFMAVNFAVSLAMELDQTCLLVDADLRRPSVHKYFGLPAAPGLANFLIDHTALDSMMVNPGIERLVVLPSGPAQQNSAELLGSVQTAALVADLKARYADRIIVFDLPPVLRAADALAFAPLVDAMVMVVAEGEAERDEIVRARQLLGRSNLIGVVLNKSDEPFDPQAEEAPPPRGFLARVLRRRA
jgi:capsular exopolysaccharide synthesis family protein